MTERPLAADPFTTTNGHTVPRPAAPPRRRSRGPVWNIVLFVLTCFTTLLAGTMFSGSPTFDAFRTSREPFQWLLSGLPFAATLLAIIRMRSAVRDRNALFDIAAAGPLAGLAVALPAALLGLAWSTLVPAPPGPHLVFGESILTRVLVWLRFGALPDGMVVSTHPIADAAWFGFLVTALNLLPAGQLDGGRIGYALLPRHHATLGRVTVAALVTLGAVVAALQYVARPELTSLIPGVNWFVLAALIRFALGYGHGSLLDPLEPLTRGRRVVGIACLVLLVLMLPPVLIRAD